MAISQSFHWSFHCKKRSDEHEKCQRHNRVFKAQWRRNFEKKGGRVGERKKRGGNGIVLHQRGKVSNCRASKWEIWRNGISKCKLLFVRNYKRCILEQCAMWEKQISGSALETPMQIKYFSQTEHQNIFHCVRTTFGHQRLPFSTKQDLANGWKSYFWRRKKQHDNRTWQDLYL